MKKLLLILLGFQLSVNCLKAANYYLSNTGNDNADGTTPSTAWQTLEKLSLELIGPSGTWSLRFNPNDSILFNRGDTFRGVIQFTAFNSQLLHFGAYGIGEKPVIKGSEKAENWTLHSGNIWRCSFAEEVQFLYINQVLQTSARLPNTGFWNHTGATTTSVTYSEIGNSGLNLIGSSIIFREYEWRINKQMVTNQNSNTVSWNNPVEAVEAGGNFYFNNAYSLLDTAGEWYYDAPNQLLYFIPPVGINPNDLLIEASIYSNGFNANDNRSANSISNLQFLHFAENGIRFTGASNNNLIQNCVFKDNFVGIFLGGNNTIIRNNEVLDSYFQSIAVANFANGLIENNTVINNSLFFGLHRPNYFGDIVPNAIWVINGLPGGIVRRNFLENMGNNGIRFSGNGLLISENYVKNALLNMADGGSIYTFGADSYNIIIRKNVVDSAYGDYKGLGSGGIVNGIYIDNYANNILIDSNTITKIPTGSGILINAGAFECDIRNNTIYKTRYGVTFADWMPGPSVQNNTLKRNILFTNVVDASPILVLSDDNNYNVLSASDSNVLGNPYATRVAFYDWAQNRNFTLQEWQTENNFDQNGSLSPLVFTPQSDSSFIIFNVSDSVSNYNFANVLDIENNSLSSLSLQPYESAILFGNSTPLNLDFLDFNAKLTSNKTVLIEWESGFSKIPDSYIIEHSVDAKNFFSIGEISDHNANSSRYEFIHQNPSIGTNYYRLKSINKSSLAFSNIKVVKLDSLENVVNIFPNPFTDQLYINSDLSNFTYTLRDLNGKELLKGKIESNKWLDFSTLSPGLYLLELKTEHFYKNYKIQKL